MKTQTIAEHVTWTPPAAMAVPSSHERKREILLSQHAALRDRLFLVREVARTPNVSSLAHQIAWLRDQLEAHLHDEEAFLEPILGRLDAWGPQRLELLRGEHAHQRALLAALCGPGSVVGHAKLVRRALSFADELLDDMADELLDDMAAEEAGFLDASTLRDDLIAIAPEPE